MNTRKIESINIIQIVLIIISVAILPINIFFTISTISLIWVLLINIIIIVLVVISVPKTYFSYEYFSISRSKILYYKEVKDYTLYVGNKENSSSRINGKFYLCIQLNDDQTRVISLNRFYSIKHIEQILEELQIRTGIKSKTSLKDFSDHYKKRKKILVLKTVLTHIIVLAPICYAILRENVIKPFIKHDLNIYLEDAYLDNDGGRRAKDFLPEIDELTNYKSLDFYRTYGDKSLIPLKYAISTFCLMVEYDSNTFESEKNNIFSKYQFAEDSKPGNLGQVHIVRYTKISDWEFNTVLDSKFFYPGYYGSIGINDKTHTISYIYFWDLGLDFYYDLDYYNKYYKTNLPWLFK